jgi:hypothetical protein
VANTLGMRLSRLERRRGLADPLDAWLGARSDDELQSYIEGLKAIDRGEVASAGLSVLLEATGFRAKWLATVH